MTDFRVRPLTPEEMAQLRAFYIDRTTTRLPSGLNPSQTIPRLIATLDMLNVPDRELLTAATQPATEVPAGEPE